MTSLRTSKRVRSGAHARRLMAVLLCAGLVLSACGGGNGDPVVDPTDPATDPGASDPDGGDGGCQLPEGEITAENNCDFSGQTITVSTTPGGLAEGYRAGLGKLFEETTGGTIEWVEQGPDQSLAMLIQNAGRTPPPVDVVLDMYVPTIYDAARAGVFEDIDPSRIPNLRDVVDQAYTVPGLGPATWAWLIGGCINTEKFEQANVPLPTGWEDWFSSDIGAVAFPQPENPRWNLTMAALAEYYNAPLDDPSIVIDEVAKLPGLTLYASTSEGDQLVQSGDAWIVVHSDGRCNGLSIQGLPIEISNLNLQIDGVTYELIASATGPQIVKGTEKREMAEALINTLFTPEALLPLTTALIYNPTKPSVIDAMMSNADVAQYLRTDFSTLWSNPEHFAAFMENRQVWVDAWNRTFQ